jgi:hypothetical protein
VCVHQDSGKRKKKAHRRQKYRSLKPKLQNRMRKI